MANFRGFEWIIIFVLLAMLVIPVIVIVRVAKRSGKTTPAPYSAPAGYYPDPQTGQQRWWNGATWAPLPPSNE